MSKIKITKKDLLTSIKGVCDIEEPKYFAYQGLFEKASEIALYYGFRPIELPILEKEILYETSIGTGTDTVEKELCSFKMKNDRVTLRPEGAPCAVRAYIEHNMQTRPQPVMLYHYGSFFQNKKGNENKKESKHFGLEILGTSKSVADATVIKVSVTILKEAGFKDLRIQINSIGDKESRQAYTKELVSFYKKNLSEICPVCRDRLKTNPLQLLTCSNEKCQKVRTKAPDSISFLSAPAKNHFREVLEYLDAMELPYEIDSSLIPKSNYYNQTIFNIIEFVKKEEKEEEITKEDDFKEKNKDEDKKSTEEKTEINIPIILARGGRYDNLAKQLGHKKDVPSVCATIEIDSIIESPSHKPITSRMQKKPKVYFIQLGFDAKLKSLFVIETLRVAHIPIMQSLAKDRLSSQLAIVEKLNIPYTIILGQREALDNTVIIRNMETRSQDTVSIDKLSDYIKSKIK